MVICSVKEVIVLDKDKIKILKFVNSESETTVLEVYKKFNDNQEFQSLANKMISIGYLSEDENHFIRLTDKGYVFLIGRLDKCSENIKFSISTSIAVLALVISIVSILSQS